MSSPALAERIQVYSARTAIVEQGRSATYGELHHAATGIASALEAATGRLAGERVVYLLPAGLGHVEALLGIWACRAVAVPLSSSQAAGEWAHIIADARPAVVVGDEDRAGGLHEVARAAGVRWASAAELRTQGHHAVTSSRERSPEVDAALLLYTSGTTAKPKGVVLSHANLAAQVQALVEAWEWRPEDRILHVLPLNHVHGLVNVLACALWSGAVCEFAQPFDPVTTWERLSSGDVTLFMAVPTVYTRLLHTWESVSAEVRDRWSSGTHSLRLMVSGSAALPVTTLERWRAVTGHILLERYGMTEIGMALSNPLRGERRPGFVGTPLPNVEVRLVGDDGREVAPGMPGELEVRGPSVFREYWRREEATASAFRNGWFRTGDVAVLEDGSFRILGRSSVDIIKTGGYKVSALEIEEVLRDHPGVAECAVVGVPDDEWGERVAAAIVPAAGAGLTLDALRRFAAPRLARYKLPSRLLLMEALPRNAMGKVTKTALRHRFEA